MDWLYLCWLRRQPGVIVGKILVEGHPLIDVRDGGRLVIEDNVRLKSRNARYHLNIFAPVKLYVDRPGAIVKIGATAHLRNLHPRDGEHRDWPQLSDCGQLSDYGRQRT